jgi:hypothetical protein
MLFLLVSCLHLTVYYYICSAKDHPAVLQELDIVEEDDQITHLLALENAENSEDGLSKLIHITICKVVS